MARKYTLAVFIGRFQPPHLGHIHVINEGLKLADRVLVLIGSAHKPSDVKNPWTCEERAAMIYDCFESKDRERIRTDFLEDVVYNDSKWITSVQQSVAFCSGGTVPDSKICIIGHHKDASSYYLDIFPQWDLIDVGNHAMYNSTDIRAAYFGKERDLNPELSKVHKSVADKLHRYSASNHNFKNLVEETEFYKKHSEMWEGAPYTPIFVTADAVVIQAGHVLLIRRGRAPGKGHLALPGGYINADEAVYDSAIRELREETKLKSPLRVLNGSLFAQHVFDHPRRSLRGRIITHAFAFYLEQLDSKGQLQEIRGSDDAAEAMWVPLHKLNTPEYKSQMFEDHGEIIQYFVDRMDKKWK